MNMQSLNQRADEGRRLGWIFLLIFVVLAAGITSVGYVSYQSYERHYRVEVEQELSAIAALQVNDLTQWRMERLGDGDLFFKNPAFSSLVRRYLERPEDADTQRQLLDWIGKVQTYNRYDQIRVLDAQGVTHLSVPADRSPMAASVLKRIPEILRSGQVQFLDFYRNEHDQRIYLAVMIPLYDPVDASRPLGVLKLRIDPEVYLYPFIKRWPLPSLTAETLLVRREGNEVVFLNELRFQTNTALILRAPLDRVALPAAQAALGHAGVMEGIDYRGVPVVAALRSIPDSPWALVARMDKAEVYAPLRERLWMVLGMVIVLLFGAGAGLGLAWRQQRTRFYRKQYQISEALRASDIRFRRLFEAARDGILILDAGTGMVVDVNPFLVGLLGYSREAFLGKKVWELGFFKDIVANQANFAELQQKEYIHYEDMALETSDGRRIEVEFVSYLYLVNDQKVIQCNIRDISDRKRAEAEKRESEQSYQALFENMLNGFAYCKMLYDEQHQPVDFVYLAVNKAFEQLTGLKNVVGKPVSEVIPGIRELSPEVFAAYDRVATSGQPERFEFDFKSFHQWLSIAVYSPAQGYFVAVFDNITERKRAEAERAVLTQQREIALNAAHLGWWHYDPVTKIATWDERYKEIFGITGNQRPNEEILARLHPDDLPLAWAAVEATLNPADPQPYATEYRVNHPDGSVHWVETHGKAVFEGEGVTRHAVSFVGTVKDITERKRAEAEQAILEAQNRQLQKSESLGRMAGAIAHHYNNKLQTVMGNLELAMANLPPGDLTIDYLKDAMQAARRAAEVSMQMLAYLGKSSGTRKPLHLSEVCRQYLPLLQSAMPVVLETDFAAPGPVIQANANQIQQVLINLVTNAWEAVGTNRGAIRVSITTVAAAAIAKACRFPIEWQPQAGTHACLEVADAGCGIAAAEIEKIFDPFFSRKFVGRGLGLSVVLGIVKAHEGGITVESAPGRGSTFRVYFPVAAQAALPTPAGALPVPDFQAGGTVLVVEDDKSVRVLTAHVISSFGFTVLTAQDGIAALEVFRQHQAEVRCVLSDLSMPRMNGWQTIAALRQLAPGIPVILASGYDEASVMAEKHPEQPQAFLGKPYNREELRAALGRALAGSQPGMSSS
jgi:PAS domain S-box-containing protein